MNIFRFALGQMQANCYFLVQDNDCILVDPADDAPFILEELQRRNLKLIGMLATHGHFDHIMAVGEIQMSFPVPLYIFKEDQFLIDRLEKTAKHFLGFEPIVIKPKKIEYLKEGSIDMGSFHFDVVKTPGHTPGSACFYYKDDQTIFTGDTLFKTAIGRYDFEYSDREDLKKSVARILNFPEATTIYSGHGEETSIMAEQASKTAELINF